MKDFGGPGERGDARRKIKDEKKLYFCSGV
jgi:hypothetical protein